mmetsp:Transcript_67217/g.205853  ORF Transcript_67217/g.205853 Transcript_67217/m.205853 type:complete len:365 (+) Transcript_67217:716-1810(+)
MERVGPVPAGGGPRLLRGGVFAHRVLERRGDADPDGAPRLEEGLAGVSFGRGCRGLPLFLRGQYCERWLSGFEHSLRHPRDHVPCPRPGARGRAGGRPPRGPGVRDRRGRLQFPRLPGRCRHDHRLPAEHLDLDTRGSATSSAEEVGHHPLGEQGAINGAQDGYIPGRGAPHLPRPAAGQLGADARQHADRHVQQEHAAAQRPPVGVHAEDVDGLAEGKEDRCEDHGPEVHLASIPGGPVRVPRTRFVLAGGERLQRGRHEHELRSHDRRRVPADHGRLLRDLLDDADRRRREGRLRFRRRQRLGAHGHRGQGNVARDAAREEDGVQREGEVGFLPEVVGRCRPHRAQEVQVWVLQDHGEIRGQ